MVSTEKTRKKALSTINFWVYVMILFATFSSCDNYKEKTYTVISDLDWEFRQVGTDNWQKATVPGDVISDLWSKEVIPNPLYRFNEDSVQWIEDENWEYRTYFHSKVPSGKTKSYMIFSGLDTYADVYLNDSLILQADNMYRKWEIEVSSVLEEDNELRIYFHSPTKVEKKRLDALGYLPVNGNEKAPVDERTRTFSRKAPFQYGWDWGPRLVTSGIWRPIELVHVQEARLENVYFKPLKVDKSEALYTFQTTINSMSAEEAVIKVQLGDITYYDDKVMLDKGENIIDLPIEIKNPKLWWCNGYGEQHLYEVTVLIEKDNIKVDEVHDKLGVRSLRLVQKKDDVGRSFYFELNGVPIFAKGANYIPNETLVTRITPDTYKRVIEDAIAANMNMLRVWGGAIYEDDLFYDLCDQYGILVWQDFMFACETTPPTDYMFESIRQEAIDNVVRLRNHACISLWCGDNENLIGWNNWGWKEIHTPEIDSIIYAGYRHISTEILSEVVGEYHPEVHYWATSPAAYPGDQLADRLSGDEHDWTIWFGQKDFEAYGEEVPRFVSEYGVQSLPEKKTVMTFADSADLDLDSDVMNHRQRSDFSWMEEGMNGNDVMIEYSNRYFHSPIDFSSSIYLTQLMQARALKTAVNAHRKNKPYCMGSLYWQLNDCWPTISWASVDYYGRWKASHYWIREAFDTVSIIPQWEGEELNITVSSDAYDLRKAMLKIYSFPLQGSGQTKLIWQDSIDIDFAKAIEVEGVDKIKKDKQEGLLLVWEYGDGQSGKTILLPDRPKNMAWYDSPITTKQKRLPSGKWQVEISSTGFAYSVQLNASVDGGWSDNYFSLLPGEKKQIIFTPKEKTEKCDFSAMSYSDFIK